MARQRQTKPKRAKSERVVVAPSRPGFVRASLVGPGHGSTFSMNPRQPTAVLAAFEAVGVKGPYCQFYRVEPLSADAIQTEHAQIQKLPPSKRVAALSSRLSPKWFQCSETDWTFTTCILTPEVTVRRTLLPGQQQPWVSRTMIYSSSANLQDLGGNVYHTGVGAVEQWLALSQIFTDSLRWFRSYPADLEGGQLVRDRDVTPAKDLIIGTTDGRPVLGLGTPADFSVGADPNDQRRVLPHAAQSLLVWAVAHDRLRRMFDAVADLLVRSGMQSTAEYLERRVPILEWEDNDFALLKRVRRELLTFAPVWSSRQSPAGREVSPPNAPVPLTRRHWVVLFRLQKFSPSCLTAKQLSRVRSSWQHEVSIKDESTVGALCKYLMKSGLISRPFTSKDGYALSDRGLELLASPPEMP